MKSKTAVRGNKETALETWLWILMQNGSWYLWGQHIAWVMACVIAVSGRKKATQQWVWPSYQQGTGIYRFSLLAVIIFIFLTKQNGELCIAICVMTHEVLTRSWTPSCGPISVMVMPCGSHGTEAWWSVSALGTPLPWASKVSSQRNPWRPQNLKPKGHMDRPSLPPPSILALSWHKPHPM